MRPSASLTLLYVGLIGQTVLSQDTDLAHSFNHSRIGITETITETTWVYPVVTMYGARERQCGPQSLELCVDVSRSMFSMGSMTTAPLPTSTATLQGPFAIEVQTLQEVVELTETQYLAIAGEYVVLYPGPHIPGWYIDSDGNLIFDNTGFRLGIAPLDIQTSNVKRMLRIDPDQDNNGYDTIIAGNREAPVGANIFTRWHGDPRSPTSPLQIIDQDNNVTDLGFMGCKFVIPDLGVKAWQLEAAYNVEGFLQSNETSSVVDPEFCASVLLLPVTSVPVSTAVSSHTSNYITTSSSSVASITPTPTETTWTSFPIQVDFDTSNSPDTEAEYYIEEDENGYAYVDATTDPPYYHYHNDSGLLSSEVSGNYLKIAVVDSPNSLSSSSSAGRRRQISNGDNFEAIVEGETIIPAGINIPTFLVCPPNSTDTDNHSLILAYDPDTYIQQNSNLNCVTASLSLNTNAPTPSTTIISTTITTTELPTVTATALSPNIIGCNALNYTLAYSTTGVMNSFATACWCYSYLASTISAITTQDCTPTIYKVVPSITSISVSGVLSSTTSGSGAIRSDRESINSHHRFILPRNTTAVAGTTTISTPATTTTNNYEDITVVPTPTEWFSAVEASPAYFTSFCDTMLEGNRIETLTITSLSVVSNTVGSVVISQTTVQTVCYQEVWEPAVTMSTPAIVICPVTVTGSS